MTLPICEKLLAERWLRNDKHGNSFYEDINPDGPEAADLIETLVDAGQRVLNGLNARIDAADPASVPLFDGIAELHAALRKARGENTPGSEEMK